MAMASNKKRRGSPGSNSGSDSKRSKNNALLSGSNGEGEVTIPAPVQLPLSASPTIENSQRVAEERESKRYQKSYSLSPTQAHSEPGCSMAIDMATKSSVEKPDVRRKHKHRRNKRDTVEDREDQEETNQESPSKKRPRESAGPSREAGEIPEGRDRGDKAAQRRQTHHRSHSRTRAKEGAGPLPAQAKLANSAAKASLPSQGRPERQSQARPPPISLRLGGIPEDLRQAALAIQKKRQEAEAAAEEARKEAEALEQKLKETVAEPPVKPSPSKWNGKGNPGAEPSPAKRARLPSSSERAREELTLQETLHRAEGDLGTQAAVKASPSFSGSEIGEIIQQCEEGGIVEAETLPAVGITSKWLQVEEEEDDSTAVKEQANREDAKLAALNKEEQQDLEITREMEDPEKEWDDDEDLSDFQRTRLPVNMLNGSRRVECFEKLNRISEGTYGVVIRARDKETNTVCALKKIKLDKETDGFPLTSIREINILLCFHHKNIVDVSEVVVGSSLDDIFMVMEFMEHDLRDLMERMTMPFTVAETKNLMKQLLEGIAYLHSNWVLHRDLKTSNILYNNKGQLKICDFGLARQYGSPLRPYTHNVVTLFYRSIELLLGAKEYSTAVDIWSLGCIMAELLTKKILFQGKGEIDQIDKIFKILGSPNEKVWPGYKELDGVKKLNLRQQRRTLHEVLPAAHRSNPDSGLTEAGFDLIERMLTLDPKQRISAEKALDHVWFKEKPIAKENYLMPTHPTSKDGSNRQHHQRVKSRAASPQQGPNFGQVTESLSTIFGR